MIDTNLNIIGNGFDLYHGLPSSYYYFGCYLINNVPEFYEEICKMYSIGFSRSIGSWVLNDYEYIVEKMFWRTFENQLGMVDEHFIVGTNEYDLGLENSDPIDIEMNDYKNADNLKKCFRVG